MDTRRTMFELGTVMAVIEARPGCNRLLAESGPAQKRIGRARGPAAVFWPRPAANHDRPIAYRRL